ncbi:MAG: 2Fe-2S iron-sulfur cluster-binding protein [Alphaproteobacteria bacterium]|nr:2Fe-2S iron-sulfur cluster-binding protein [Alphaproteobacteria bacterium]
MPTITFIHQNGTAQTVDAPENWSILQIAQQHNIPGIEGVCGGVMACASCHVVIHPDWAQRVAAADNEKTPEEEDILDLAFDVVPTSRLGCQIKVTNELDGMVVALPGTKHAW